MSISKPRLTGRQQLAAISRSIAGLQREHYGRDTAKVNAYAVNDMIVVVLRSQHLTPLEKSLVAGGEPERVLALRAQFASVMAGRYTRTVEEVTGRTVVALLSQAHVDPDIIVELFFLDRRFASQLATGLADVIGLPEASTLAATGGPRSRSSR
ncbi:MAG: Na-translocating system protein MpsC family protein [Solirubrobacteraceae bacterium]